MKKNISILVILGLFPLTMLWADQLFYVSFASRVMIYAIAATSLNLVLGYGGMISFGHAAFVGTGAYVGSILVAEGVTSAFIGWPARCSPTTASTSTRTCCTGRSRAR